MLKVIHPIAGLLALITISVFWISTVSTELIGQAAMIVTVKTAIPWGFILLISALMVTGGSGFSLSKHRSGRLVDVKRQRMTVIAANGIFVLVPAAFFLAFKADAGELDLWFSSVQLLELLAGAINITLLALNLRDGIRLSGRWGNAQTVS